MRISINIGNDTLKRNANNEETQTGYIVHEGWTKTYVQCIQCCLALFEIEKMGMKSIMWCELFGNTVPLKKEHCFATGRTHCLWA